MPKKQSCRSNRICFTLNNYTDEECRLLENFCKTSGIVYAIIGKEKGKSGTPHLQGFIHLATSRMKARDGNVSNWKSMCPGLQRAHLESAYGSDQDSQAYCSKDADILIEVNTPAESASVWEKLVKCQSMEEACDVSPEHFVKYYHQLEKIVEKNNTPVDVAPNQLYPWQIMVLRKLICQDKRKVLFVVDFDGDKGKTELTKYLMCRFGAFFSTGGRLPDLQHTFSKHRNCRFAAFDLPRARDFYPYEFMEQLKNGMFHSPKYNSKNVTFNPVQVVVFMNSEPDRTQLSKDRYDVIYLRDIVRELNDIPQDIKDLECISK